MKWIFLLIILLLFNLCKKETKEAKITTIEGTVINTGSKQPIDSVKVLVVDGTIVGGGIFSYSKIGSGKTNTTYTNKLGYFKIKVEGNYAFLWLEKTGYRFVVKNYGITDNFKEYITGSVYKNEMLELWADAYFNGVFKGINCLISDSVFFDEGKTIPKASIDKVAYVHYGNGPFKLYDKGWKGIGDKYFKFWLKYQIKGVWHERLDSVFIKSFTTYSDTIYY